MTRNASWVSALSSLVLSLFIAGCGSSSPHLPSATITITSPSTAPTLDQGQSVDITALVTVQSSTPNLNVNWAITGCAGAAGSCGSLSKATSSSVTYTAPASVPATMTVTVQATSAANPTVTANLNINVAALTVTITDKVTEIPAADLTYAGYFFPFPDVGFQEAVAHDPANAGVTWTLTANGAACSPTCGTIKLLNSSPGISFAQYTPPTTVPAAPDNQPTITATSVTDPTKSDSDTFTLFDGAAACGTQGNESLLKGQYAILVHAFGGANSFSSLAPPGSGVTDAAVYWAVFDADGTGRVTGGEDGFDQAFEGGGGGISADILPAASSYSVGPDGRGCLVLTDGLGVTQRLRFSLGGVSGGVAAKGDVILSSHQEEWNPISGSGILRLQDTSALSLAALAGNYAMGVDGWEYTTGSLTHFAIVGSFAQKDGTVSNQVFAGNDGGTLEDVEQNYFNPSIPNGTIQILSSQYGTATAQFNGLPDPASPIPLYPDISLIIINPSELFVVGFGNPTGGSGLFLFSGRAIATASSVSSSSILPQYIFRQTGSASGTASASIGTLGFSGNDTGTVSGTLDQFSSSGASSSSINESYWHSAYTGEIDIRPSNGDVSQVLYLTNPVDGISGFMMGGGEGSSLGVVEAQPNVTYSNSSLSGSFFFGSKEPGDNTVEDTSGTASIASGKVQGTADTTSSTGFNVGSTFSAPLTIKADGTGDLGTNTAAVTNGKALFFINEAAGAPPVVDVFEQ